MTIYGLGNQLEWGGDDLSPVAMTGGSRPSSPSPSLKLRSLPVIDIAPWIHPEEEHYRGHNGGRRSTAAALHAACLTYGFFYLDVSSYASQAEMDELADLGRWINRLI